LYLYPSGTRIKCVSIVEGKEYHDGRVAKDVSRR
jgi:hypothetical protein